jgi:hypothetical protein
MRVDEQATVDPEVQQIEVAEWELIEGKLCHVLVNYNDLHMLVLMGSNRLLQFWLSLYLVLPLKYFWVVLAIALYGFGYGDTLFMITLLLSFYYYCSC